MLQVILVTHRQPTIDGCQLPLATLSVLLGRLIPQRSHRPLS